MFGGASFATSVPAWWFFVPRGCACPGGGGSVSEPRARDPLVKGHRDFSASRASGMRNISAEMLLLLHILGVLPLARAAPSQTTEQLDTGVVSFIFYFCFKSNYSWGAEGGGF